MDWQAQIRSEFEKAETARSRGNEGRARVCARRAAGIAARAYFVSHGRPLRNPSAYDALNLLTQEMQLSDELRRAAAYLTLRVDEEFKLPAGLDLIAEARRLCDELAAWIKP